MEFGNFRSNSRNLYLHKLQYYVNVRTTYNQESIEEILNIVLTTAALLF